MQQLRTGRSLWSRSICRFITNSFHCMLFSVRALSVSTLPSVAITRPFLYSRSKHLSDRTAGIHLMAIHCAAAEHGVLITRKRGNYECIATWGCPTPRRPFHTLTTTSRQVWSHSTYPLPYYSVFVAVYYITLRCERQLWPLTLNVYSVLPVAKWNSVPNLNAIKQSAVELLRF